MFRGFHQGLRLSRIARPLVRKRPWGDDFPRVRPSFTHHRQLHKRPFASKALPDDEEKEPVPNGSVASHLPDMPLSLVYHNLNLQTFSNEEIDDVFDAITSSSITHPTNTQDDDERNERNTSVSLRVVNHSNLSAYLQQKRNSPDPDFAASQILQFFAPSSSMTLSKSQFRQHLNSSARTVDYRSTLPISATLFLVGVSVGVVTPAMPFVMTDLGLTASEYGAVISAFGLAKFVGNVPAAVLVERHGRKPFMTYSMALLAAGVAGIGVATNFSTLYGLRLCTGLGVAALSTAGTLMVTDLSTPLNRAQTFAPVFSAFSVGTVLGPGIGGYLVDAVGVPWTMAAVGCAYVGVGALNRLLLSETALPSTAKATSFVEGLHSAFVQWGTVWKTHPSVRNVIVMNGVYWIVLAGSQMTILPLLLVKSFTASTIGQVYTGMAAVQIVGNPITARVSDKVGRLPVMVAGTTIMGLALSVIPQAVASADPAALPLALAAWSFGSSMMSSAPLAYVSDQSTMEQRAPTVALLRTAGDLGLLVGAASFGALANATGALDMTLHIGSGVLLVATGAFAVTQPRIWSGRVVTATSAQK